MSFTKSARTSGGWVVRCSHPHSSSGLADMLPVIQCPVPYTCLCVCVGCVCVGLHRFRSKWNRADEGVLRFLSLSRTWPRVAPVIAVSGLNHASYPCATSDIRAMAAFYAGVLGFERVPRPNFPFDGAPLDLRT
eukprot:1184179-Prorocentrum_minimum.AAC.14